MALWSRGGVSSPPNHRAVVGAARRINLGRRVEIERLRRRQSSSRQRIAWAHYDSIGEVKYAFNYLANTLSRIRLYGAYISDDRDGPPAPVGTIGGIDRDLVTTIRYEIGKLDTAHGGQPGLIRAYSLNRSVAGEMYLAEVGDRLGIYSTNEVEVSGGGGSYTNQSGVRLRTQRNIGEMDWITLPEDAFVARIWRPHPAWSDEADSSLMGVRESADELLMLGRMIRAITMRQLNAGILYVADELTFERRVDVNTDPAPDDDPDNPDTGEPDVFDEELEMFLTEPIDDEMSAAMLNPLVVRGPADMAENAIKAIALGGDFDQKVVELRTAALDRVLNGIDIPKDLVTGLAEVRYSNAQQISEDLYKSHIEPAAVELCEAFAVTRLRPALQARGFSPDQVARATVWYDASEITVASNRAQDADAGHDRILISDATWRRDHGFTDDDKPDEKEVARRLAEKNSLAPETAIQMLAALMPLIGQMATNGQIVLQPSSMNPQRPPHIPAVTQAKVPGAPEPGQPPGSNLPAPIPVGEGGATPAGSDGALPPPNGTPAPTTPVGQPMPTVAAGSPTPAKPLGEKELKRLLEIERRLRTSLQTMFTDMTERALEKAGSRLASKLRGNAEQSAKIKDVPKTMVASVLGPEVVRAAGFTDQQLANEQIDQTENKYLQAVMQAQSQADRVLGQEVFGGNDEHISQSWALLKPLLVAFVLKSLFRKEHDGYQPKLPMDSVRTALARAGGGAPASPIHDGPQPGAVLNSRSVDALSSRFDADQAGYRWVYGISDNHFEPHLDLDGVEFSSWRDEAIKNKGTWPRVEYLHPGDHSGCECDVLPALVPRQGHEGEIGGKHLRPEPVAAGAAR